MTGISDTIKALTGEEAIRVLVDTADHEALPDPGHLRVIESALHEAITADTGPASYARPGLTASSGDLVRATCTTWPSPVPTWFP